MPDDPQLRAKLETLMLVYPDVTVARALHFLDEADQMISKGQAYRVNPYRELAPDERVREPSFEHMVRTHIANDDRTQEIHLDDTEEMQP